MKKRKPKIVITNTFSIWMTHPEEVLHFTTATIDEVKNIMNDGHDVQFWTSNEKAAEKIKKILGLKEIILEETFPRDWDTIIVIGGPKKITKIEHMTIIVPHK